MLGKGDACLPCRKLKAKCDGSKPACSRCQRFHKACEYASGRAKRKRRTQPPDASAVTAELIINRLALSSTHDLSLISARLLHQILGPRGDSNPKLVDAKSALLPIYPQFEALGDQIPGGDSIERYLSVIQRTVVEDELESYQWQQSDELPPQLSRYLISLFLPHRSRLHFLTDVHTFLNSLCLPPSHPASIHLCLRYACCLGACTLMGGRLAALKPYLLSRTRHHLDQALMLADRLPHFLWASIILTGCLAKERRLDEAFAVISAAARLATACGLASNPATPHVPSTPNQWLLPPAKDDIEAADRIRLMHSIYLTDQVIATISNYRRTLVHDDRLIFSPEDDQSIRQLYAGEVSKPWQSLAHLKVPMVELFENVIEFAQRSYENGSVQQDEDYFLLKAQIMFFESLVPSISDPLGFEPFEIVSSFSAHLFFVRATLYGSGMVLHSLRAGKDYEARGLMRKSTRALVSMCEQIRGQQHLEKIHACLPSMRHVINAVRILAHELRAPEVKDNARLSADYCNAIRYLLDFLDDVIAAYPAWVDAPASLKDIVIPAVNALRT